MKKQVLFGIALLCSAFLSNVRAAGPAVDPATYAPRGDNGEYTFENKWLYSAKRGNYNTAADLIGTAGVVRGMAAKDGKMLFIDRENKQITVVNGETGLKEAPIMLASYIFTDDEGNQAGTLPFNDIKIDNAGNVLLGNCITSNAQPFQIWKVNLEDGTGTLVINQADLEDLFPDATIRFDAFGVYGDVDNDAIIMAQNQLAMETYKWTITDGVAGDPEVIYIDNVTEGTYLTGMGNPGTAPQVFPVDENYYYLDGNATFPTLIDMDGNIIDDFFNKPSALVDEITSPGNSWRMNEGHNGIAEFQVGDEYFVVMAATNTAATPPSTFRLFKFADAGKAFEGLQCLWTFPQEGMGGTSNPYRTAVPSVEVEGNTAKIYVYTGENGYGLYDFIVNVSGIKDVKQAVVKISVDGNKINFLDGPVSTVNVYGVTGQLVTKATNVESITVPKEGVYVVKATTMNGETAIQKVIAK